VKIESTGILTGLVCVCFFVVEWCSRPTRTGTQSNLHLIEGADDQPVDHVGGGDVTGGDDAF
jgi:hypothetical protein